MLFYFAEKEKWVKFLKNLDGKIERVREHMKTKYFIKIKADLRNVLYYWGN